MEESFKEFSQRLLRLTDQPTYNVWLTNDRKILFEPASKGWMWSFDQVFAIEKNTAQRHDENYYAKRKDAVAVARMFSEHLGFEIDFSALQLQRNEVQIYAIKGSLFEIQGTSGDWIVGLKSSCLHEDTGLEKDKKHAQLSNAWDEYSYQYCTKKFCESRVFETKPEALKTLFDFVSQTKLKWQDK